MGDELFSMDIETPTLSKKASLWAESAAKAKAALQTMKKNVIVPLTEAEWTAMNGKARWDSIVGLRGPDLVGSGILKWFTSSVIRHKMSGIMRVGGLVNQTLPFVVLPSGYDNSRKRANFDASHFIGHVSEAAEWLGIPRAYIGWEDYNKLLITPCGEHYYQTELQLYPLLIEPYRTQLGAIILSRGGVLPEKEDAPCQE